MTRLPACPTCGRDPCECRPLPSYPRLPLLLLALVVGCSPPILPTLEECRDLCAGAVYEWSWSWRDRYGDGVGFCECSSSSTSPPQPAERGADLSGYQAWLDSGGIHDLDGSVLR